MRPPPPDWVEKYFRRERRQFVLDKSVQAMVRFEERSIAREDYQFWQPHRFDIVFCRNVIMYLSARVVSEVLARFARVLASDGFLFLSHAEPLRGISQAFHVEHAQGTFYYVLRDAGGSNTSPRPGARPGSIQRSTFTAGFIVGRPAVAEPGPPPLEAVRPAEKSTSLTL